jgi:glycosyltransferase involved in cell wall biosynthesis
MKPLTNFGLTIFFPVFNEIGNLREMCWSCADVLPRLTTDPELLVIDDGSGDGTSELADQLTAQIPFLKVIHHEKNKGYGAALQSGFRAASKDLVFYTDGDRQFDLDDLSDILPMIQDADVISCFRKDRRDPWLRSFNTWLFEKAVSFIFGLKIKDPDCAFKVYRQEVLSKLTMASQGALIDVEMLLQAQRLGFRIIQTGVRHLPRKSGKPSGANPRVILRAFKEIIQLSQRVGTRFRRRTV